ncbi:uncharacterized protein [Primulina eburnea]|uniref:uncharacterized protein n=1 Tax=Primulina eburnea TaxID=1245227 RepID=UPI003C6CC240
MAMLERIDLDMRGSMEVKLDSDHGILDTFYKKRESDLVTFRNVHNISQIDYFLVRSQDLSSSKDCMVILGEYSTTQHRLLMLDLCLKSGSKVNNDHIRLWIKWRTMKGDAFQILSDKILDSQLVLEGCEDVRRKDKIDTSGLFELMANHIKSGVREVLGKAKRKGRHDKETWSIKHEDGRILMQGNVIPDRRMNYFKKSLNGTSWIKRKRRRGKTDRQCFKNLNDILGEKKKIKSACSPDLEAENKAVVGFSCPDMAAFTNPLSAVTSDSMWITLRRRMERTPRNSSNRMQCRCRHMLASPRRQLVVFALLSLSYEVVPLRARAGSEEGGLSGALKSLFDPNEKTQSGKVLPKAYLKSAREVLKTLRESLQEDTKDMAKFRRTADAAKESIRGYLSGWRGQNIVSSEESYVMIEKAIRSLANFYSKAGPSAPLPEDVKAEILSNLSAAEQSL